MRRLFINKDDDDDSEVHTRQLINLTQRTCLPLFTGAPFRFNFFDALFQLLLLLLLLLLRVHLLCCHSV
jgi:hypothetical protein